MEVTTAQRTGWPRAGAVAPATALVMLAVQVGSNAARDALFLTVFPVTALPWFVAAAAVAAFPAAHCAGWLLLRHGPYRIVPVAFAATGTLFAAEAALIPRHTWLAAIVLFFHATVVGVTVISMFWSLLDERFDPHTAKRLFSHVAGAATLGAVLGGVGTERLAVLGSPVVVLVVLAAGAAGCSAGTIALGRGAGSTPIRARDTKTMDSAVMAGGRRPSSPATARPYLRMLALLATLAALAATLCDYVFKAGIAAHVAGGVPLFRVFGLFHATTGLAAFALQVTLAPVVLTRLRIPGALAAHPLAVGGAGLVALLVPTPWGGVLLRGADVTARRSVFRTGYELLYTPLPDAERRVAKASIDVGWDCVGSGAGAAVVFLLTRLTPASAMLLTLAAVSVAAAEFLVTRRLGTRHGLLLAESVRRRGAALHPGSRYTIDRGSLSLLLAAEDLEGGEPTSSSPSEDPVPEAMAALRSNDAARIRAALPHAARDLALVGAVVTLLDRDDVLDEAANALRAHGPRIAGQLGDALVDPATPEAVRRRIPLVLAECPSQRSLEVVLLGLADASLTVRARCGQALLRMSDADAALEIPREAVLAAAGRELDAGASSERSLGHAFDLLALVVGRQTMAIARRAHGAGDAQVLGTVLAYLETVLPRPLFANLERRLLGRVRQNVG